MKKLFTALALATALSACTPIDIVSKPPAPLEQTTIDERGLKAALSSFDVFLTAVDGLVATGYLVPGSPKALKVQSLIRTVQTAFNGAIAAQKAGSAKEYATAMTQAQLALNELSSIFKKGN